jgi:hypothetical protein
MKEMLGFTINNGWLRRRIFTEKLHLLPAQTLEINVRVCPQF